MQLPGFIGPSYTLQSTNIECQRTVNLYPVIDESGVGRNVAALVNTPGLKAYCDLGTNAPVRALFTTSHGRVFCVSATGFFEIHSDKTFTHLGTLLTKVGRVGIAENGQQMMIVDGPYGYSFNLTTNAFAQLADFPGGVTVAYQDGFFIFNQPNTQKFYISGILDVTVDPLDFASAEGNPDNLLAVISDRRQLYLIGAQSIEFWFNSGAELFPFQRIDGAYISRGTIAPYSAVALDNTIYWLGQDTSGIGMVWRASGYQPVRASTFAMEQAISRYPRMDDATGFAYQQDGHSFYVLNFPSGNTTWVYDAATQLWHERAYLQPTGFLSRHRAEVHTVGFGIHLVGDYQNGKIYQLDPLTYNDQVGDTATAIKRIRTAPYIAEELKNLVISKFQLDMQTGLGDPSITPSSIITTNANGQIWVLEGRPLDLTAHVVQWSNFAIPSGKSLPSDAVIQGIYPVAVASAKNTTSLQRIFYQKPIAVPFHHPFLSNPGPGTDFPSTEFYDVSIGTSLSALTGYFIQGQLDCSITAPNLMDYMNITAVGFAIYYTSATPQIDPAIPPPFAVPAGQGILFAVPSTVTTNSDPNEGMATITSSAVSGGVATFEYQTIFGPFPTAGLGIRLSGITSVPGLNGFHGSIATATGGPSGSFTLASGGSAPVTVENALACTIGPGGVPINSTGASEGSPASQVIVPAITHVADPSVILDWSDDGGHTWSNEYAKPLGKIGETKKRAIWRRLGRSRERVFRVTITDPVPVAIIDAYIDVEAGTS